ncbi:MAG: ImmA/IrrE family metallo-endopeptidase [Actinomycetota bacterium]|nr:ImmA/IrrE family metallo-endopeptidase [Actinomycetota bacterium]
MAELGFPQPWSPLDIGLLSGGWTAQGAQLARAALDQVGQFGSAGHKTELPDLVETKFGADVAVLDLGGDFDGLATSSDEVKLIVLATSQVPARQRFTLAHELGHLLAGDDQGVHLDVDVFDQAGRRTPSEMRANAFAACFLMPEETLRTAVGTVGLTEETFATLACDLVVTPSALAYRLKELRLIDAGACDRFRTLTGRMAASIAGRRAEFAQLVAEASRPRPPGLLAQDTYAAHDAGRATLRPYANLIGADVDSLRRSLERENGSYHAS